MGLGLGEGAGSVVAAVLAFKVGNSSLQVLKNRPVCLKGKVVPVLN
jgi:hypothetical protein